MKNIPGCIAVLALLLLCNQATAVPFTFSPGEPARAADVNANFSDLDNRVQANTNKLAAIGSYDFRNYLPAKGVTSASFSVSNNPSISGVTWTYTPNADYSQLRIDRVLTLISSSSKPKYTFVYAVGPASYARISNISYQADNTTVASNYNFDPPLVIAAIPASPGASWTTVTQSTQTDATNSSNVLSIASQITTSNFVGVEDVTVPYNGGTTYKACLKFSVLTYTPVGGTGGMLTGNSMSWFCKGVGLVKRIRIDLTNTTTMNPTSVWELTGLTIASP